MNRYFSTTPVFSAPVSAIDKEQGIIRGVTIARLGPAKGHEGFIDRTFLLQVVENAATKPAGIKARFGHPNMCNTALGTYLGRFKNYSYANDKVNADLFLDSTARNTPGGDLYTYVLDMAEQNPDMFGASIVFEIADSVFLEEEVDGEKVQKEYFRLRDLRATDIVDEPAATEGLFSVRMGGIEALPGIATQFLDENPQLLELLFSKPDTLVEFLTNYLSNSNMNFSEKIRQNFASFLAAFSLAPPSGNTVPSSTPSQTGEGQDGISSPDNHQDNTLNTLFDAASSSFPASFPDKDGITALQKAEALTAFFSTVSDQLSEADTKLRYKESAFNALADEHKDLIASASQLTSELETANTRIAELNEQLSARPSIPLNVTDPALSLSTSQEKDESGKQILSQLPKDLKRKLQKQS